jgi:tetratricopeptide (TPR) repeat protein
MNDGGNNGLLKPIIVGLIRLPEIDRPGHLFVITSRNTYSAAQNLVNRLELYTDAIFVGQPTGQHVNSYGDPVAISLPNSHLTVGMSSVWWQDGDERDKRIETDPELAADYTFADYVANRDPALTVIADYRSDRIQDDVLSGITAGGVAGGLAAYRAYVANALHRYVRPLLERRVNLLGYDLFGERRFADAIAVFTVNAEANPTSANAQDSLGEAYVDAGDREKAIAAYRQALGLDPNLQSSRAALGKLGAAGP